MERAFDRVLLARHFALSVGAIAAYLLRAEWQIGYVALWVVGISATLNFLAYAFGARPSMTRICMGASPVIGVGGWTALVAVTGGIDSPFVPGLWLEIVLSAMSLNLRNIVLVTSGSVAGLWLQQAWLGMPGETRAIVLQSGFMVGMGLATFLVTRRWIGRQSSMVVEKDALDQRLGVLTRELEDERTVAALGESVARLAHGIKNAVHSLRGFVQLIEPQLQHQEHARSALAGLRSAIDDLEALARATLSPEPGLPSPAAAQASPAGAGPGQGAAAEPALEQALAEVRRSSPDVVWEVRNGAAPSGLSIPEASLSETVIILLRNAVEAMQGQGVATVESVVLAGLGCFWGGYPGRGRGGCDVEELFKPGFTTKSTGSGYGLFLARRIAEEHGGTIHASDRPGGGALFELVLPVGGGE